MAGIASAMVVGGVEAFVVVATVVGGVEAFVVVAMGDGGVGATSIAEAVVDIEVVAGDGVAVAAGIARATVVGVVGAFVVAATGVCGVVFAGGWAGGGVGGAWRADMREFARASTAVVAGRGLKTV